MKGHPIKEFDEEVEPKIRKCLLCKNIAPSDISTNEMTLRKTYLNKGWYSNAGLNIRTRLIARFYLCPTHRGNTDIAWEWVREGFELLAVKRNTALDPEAGEE